MLHFPGLIAYGSSKMFVSTGSSTVQIGEISTMNSDNGNVTTIGSVYCCQKNIAK